MENERERGETFVSDQDHLIPHFGGKEGGRNETNQLGAPAGIDFRVPRLIACDKSASFPRAEFEFEFV